MALTMLTGIMLSSGITAHAYELFNYTQYGEAAEGTVFCKKGSSNSDASADCDYYIFKAPSAGKLTIDAFSTSDTKPKYEVYVSFFDVIEKNGKRSTKRIKDYNTEVVKKSGGAKLKKTVEVKNAQYALCFATPYYDLTQSYSFTLTFKPLKPVLTVTEAKRSRVKAKWNRVSGVAGYELQYADNKKMKNAVTIETTGEKSNIKLIKGLEKGKRYFYRVRCIAESGSGDSAQTFVSAWSKKRPFKLSKDA